MVTNQYLGFWVLCFTFVCANSQFLDIFRKYEKPWLSDMVEAIKSIATDDEVIYPESDSQEDYEEDDIVKIRVYYESQCSGCMIFYSGDLVQVAIKYEKRLDVKCYPYGKANTTEHPDGTFDIICPHSETECYGNQLHACTYDLVKNYTEAISFVGCLMSWSEEDRGSNDKRADKCGKELNIDSEAIKACAKSQKGKDLHHYYGKETEKIHFSFVPYVLVNDVQFAPNTKIHFEEFVCKSFKNPPANCPVKKINY